MWLEMEFVRKRRPKTGTIMLERLERLLGPLDILLELKNIVLKRRGHISVNPQPRVRDRLLVSGDLWCGLRETSGETDSLSPRELMTEKLLRGPRNENAPSSTTLRAEHESETTPQNIRFRRVMPRR